MNKIKIKPKKMYDISEIFLILKYNKLVDEFKKMNYHIYGLEHIEMLKYRCGSIRKSTKLASFKHKQDRDNFFNLLRKYKDITFVKKVRY